MLNEEVHLIRNNQHFKYFFNKAHVTATQQVSPATSICMCSCRGAATVTRKGPQQLPYACLVFADSLSVLAIWTLCGSEENYACTCKLFYLFLDPDVVHGLDSTLEFVPSNLCSLKWYVCCTKLMSVCVSQIIAV